MTDVDSVTINNLRDSANGTFVTLDDDLPPHRSREEKLSTTAFQWFTWDSSTEVYTMVIAEDSQ